MIEINLKNKTIIFDSTEERALWDTFNKFLRDKNLATSTFQPIKYKVTKVFGSDIYGAQTGILPMHRTIRINRNTLFVSASIYRKEALGGVIESSYKCEKADRGF